MGLQSSASKRKLKNMRRSSKVLKCGSSKVWVTGQKLFSVSLCAFVSLCETIIVFSSCFLGECLDKSVGKPVVVFDKTLGRVDTKRGSRDAHPSSYVGESTVLKSKEDS